MQKILIAPDSFKGSLSADEVADAIAEGLDGISPECHIVKIPVSDGGDGMLSVFSRDKCCKKVNLIVRGPSGKETEAEYLIKDGTAIIETSQACGLTLLKQEERNPLSTSTYGVGEIIQDALWKGCRKFILGLGGSSTNDGGAGMLEALGCQFKDNDGNLITSCTGNRLGEIAEIDISGISKELRAAEFIAACDVDASFTGPNGATAVFAAQKGADKDMITALEAKMYSFEKQIRTHLGTDLSKIKGSGAAGGLGGALKAFLGAEIQKGADLILSLLDFDRHLQSADLVITGEGRIDSQTLMGKIPGTIARKATALGIPTIAVCGISTLSRKDSCRTEENNDTEEHGDIKEDNHTEKINSRKKIDDTHKIDDNFFDVIITIQKEPANKEELAHAMTPEIAKENIRKAIRKYMTEKMQKS